MRFRNRLAACILGIGIVVTASSSARADVSPPDPESCETAMFKPKDEGAPCAVDGTAGTCEMAETRYKPDPNLEGDDGGAPSKRIRCVDANGKVLDLASSEEQVSQTSANPLPSSSTTPPPHEKSGCAVAPAARALGPWCIALAVPALVFALRRRRSAKR